MKLRERLNTLRLNKLQEDEARLRREINALVKDLEKIDSLSLQNVAVNHIEMKKMKHDTLLNEIEDLLEVEDADANDDDVEW